MLRTPWSAGARGGGGQAAIFQPAAWRPARLTKCRAPGAAFTLALACRLPQRSGLPYTVFHPLYIYGPETAKDCEQWFVDRVIR